MSQGSARGSCSPRYTRGVSIWASSPVGISPQRPGTGGRHGGGHHMGEETHATGGGRRRTGTRRDPGGRARRAALRAGSGNAGDPFLLPLHVREPVVPSLFELGGNEAVCVKLIPPDYVKPFVKRQQNDAADAEAICEAASRPAMRFVAVSWVGAGGASQLRISVAASPEAALTGPRVRHEGRVVRPRIVGADVALLNDRMSSRRETRRDDSDVDLARSDPRRWWIEALPRSKAWRADAGEERHDRAGPHRRRSNCRSVAESPDRRRGMCSRRRGARREARADPAPGGRAPRFRHGERRGCRSRTSRLRSPTPRPTLMDDARPSERTKG